LSKKEKKMKKTLFLMVFGSWAFAQEIVIPSKEWVENGERVIVDAWVENPTGSYTLGTVAVSPTNYINPVFSDLDGNGTFTSEEFEIRIGEGESENLTLYMLAAQSATITVDLNSDNIFGTATIRAVSRPRITTYLEEEERERFEPSEDVTVRVYGYVHPDESVKMGTLSVEATHKPFFLLKEGGGEYGTYTKTFNPKDTFGDLPLPYEILISVDLDDLDGRCGTKTITIFERTACTVTTYKDVSLQEKRTRFKNGAKVYVKAEGTSTGESVIEGVAINKDTGATCTITFRYNQNEDRYEANFTISKEGRDLQAEDGNLIEIKVDINDDGKPGSTIICADYTPPNVSVSVDPVEFSPHTSFGEKDTTTITLSYRLEPTPGSYEIEVSGRWVEEGTISDTVYFEWDGMYDGHRFSEGTHTILVKFYDEAENLAEATCTVIIDSTEPTISDLSADPEVFSPGTSAGAYDTTDITFYSNEDGRYEITIDGKTPSGTPEGTLFANTKVTYTWNGSYTTEEAPEGDHHVVVKVTDRAGNWNYAYTTVTIDRTPPRIDHLKENTGGNLFYRDETIIFTMKVSDWIGEDSIDVKNGTAYLLLVSAEESEYVDLFYVGDSFFQGYYTVEADDSGTYTVYGYFDDEAGNPATNDGTVTGAVYLDGSRERPKVSSRIVRIGIIYPKVEQPALTTLSQTKILASTTESLSVNWPEESIESDHHIKVVDVKREHIWVAPYNGHLELNNGYLYYGNPVPDYRNVEIGVAYLLKKCTKKDDDLVLTLVAMRIEEELYAVVSESSEGSLTLTADGIEAGDLICVSNSSNCWIEEATANGSFTISNRNLYSGPILSDYTQLSNLTIEKVEWAKGGDATIDIGEVRRDVPLTDDGVDGIGILAGDVLVGDGVYSGVYTVKEGDSTEDAKLRGHFVYNRKKAVNDPFMDSRLSITIDSEPPEITNISASPAPFNPYLANCEIKYNLSEKAWVKIKIYDNNENLIRVIASSEAQFGENVKTIWDGKTSANVIVEDGLYYYYIYAEDDAGNEAITKRQEIRVTSIEIRIEEINVTPNPFIPNPEENSVDVIFWFEISLVNSANREVTDEQLNNLGFWLESSWWWIEVDKRGQADFDWPYAYLYFTAFDKDGQENKIEGFPDLDYPSDIDEDPWPGGYPYWINLATYRTDEGDGDAGNDHSVLRCLHKQPDGSYRASFSVKIWNWDIPPGPYILQADAKLVGIWWDFKVEEEKDKLHAMPDYDEGYGLRSELYEIEFSVEESKPPTKPDNQAPDVVATHPAAGEAIDVTRTGSITEVWAELADNVEGSGVNLDASEIFLVDENDQKIPGYQTNDGESKIYWRLGTLDEPQYLDRPGSFTIKVKPVDNKGNGLEADYQLFSFRIKDVTPPRVFDPSPEEDSTVFTPFPGPIEVYVTDIGQGESGIDWDLTTLSLSGPQEATLTITYYEKSGKMKGELESSLTEDGTYTIYVTAYDKEGNKTEESFSFYLKTVSPIIYNPNPKDNSTVYTPYTGTISCWISELEEGASGIDWKKCELRLLDPDQKEVEMDVVYQLGTSADIGQLVGTPKSELTKPGTYEIRAKAVDKAGHIIQAIYTFILKAIAPDIKNPYPPESARIKAPYYGTVSVDISTQEIGREIDWNRTTLTLKDPDMGDIGLVTTIVGGTDSGTIIGTPTSPLITQGEYTIRATAYDKDGNSTTKSFGFEIFWSTPFVDHIELSAETFSPYTSLGRFDTVTVFFSADEDGTWSIKIEDRVLAKDIFVIADAIGSYTWRGYDVNNKAFSEGTHTIVAYVCNAVGNVGTAGVDVVIDSTPPEVIFLSASDYCFSPGVSISSQDTTEITFVIGSEPATYTITVDGNTPTGEGNTEGFLTGFSTVSFVWDGSHTTGEFEEGGHIVMVKVEDGVGNTSTVTCSVTIDRTYPEIEKITDNTGRKCFYRDDVILFTLYTVDDVVEAECVLDERDVELVKIADGVFQGEYRVKEGDVGVLEVRGSITDVAGNPGSNQDTVFGTVTVDGSNVNPISESKIIRIGALHPEEKELSVESIKSSEGSLTIKWEDWQTEGLKDGQKIKIESEDGRVWVGRLSAGGITIYNSRLYFGSPVPDYREIEIEKAFALKDIAKCGDEIEVAISCVKIEKSISCDNIVSSVEKIDIEDPEIDVGDTILVTDGSRFWLQKAKLDNIFRISNRNLYSGELVSDYTKLSGLTAEKVSFATGGDANGRIIKEVTLYDNGVEEFGDEKPGDGVYSGIYTVKSTDEGVDVPVFGYFWYNNKQAENQPYQKKDVTVTMDGIAPKIEDYRATPAPFNPEKEDLNIRYTLSEASYVKIRIYNKFDEVIRTITPSVPQFGENVTSYWDGRDSVGNVVEDGVYYYTIDAKDTAGNPAVTMRGEIRLTTVEIKVTDLKVSPDPFIIREEYEEKEYFTVKFTVRLENSRGGPVTDKQLRNLGFDFSQSPYHLNYPYALLSFSVYDAEGNEYIYDQYPDMTPDTDIDPWLFIWTPVLEEKGLPNRPNYGDYIYNSYIIGCPLTEDEGDGDKGNDFGNLLAFLKDSDGNYYCQYEYAELDWQKPVGIYHIQVSAELCSLRWEKVGEEEKFHAVPMYHGHGGLMSEPVNYRFEAKEEEPPPSPDTKPPVVIAVSTTGEVGPGDVTEVWAILYDEGVGVDFVRSEIRLLDSDNKEVAGEQRSKPTDGTGTIYWELDSPLTEPGSYTISVIAVDKNGASETYTFDFTVKDNMAPEITATYPTDGEVVTSPFYGPIWVYISEENTGKSDIDGTETTMSLSKDGKTYSLSVYLEKTGDYTWRLTGSVEDELTEAGTYTVKVKAVDVEGNLKIYSFSFLIPENIQVVDDEGNVWLDIPYDTEIDFGNKILSKLPVRNGTITIEKVADPGGHIGYQVVGDVVSFFYTTKEGTKTSLHSAKFTKDVKLILHYKDTEIPRGVKEEELSIWARGSSWTELGGEVDKDDNQVTLTISAYTKIAEMYAIMAEYTVPEELAEGVYVRPNPASRECEFVVGLEDNADVSVEVYTIAGDLVWESEKRGCVTGDVEISWGCKNRAGKRVGTGLYIYKVTINYHSGRKEVVIKKMVVIKQ
jgi:flagellar hook assembly protein FlgD